MPDLTARVRGARRPDPLDVALREIEIAVDLVSSGHARVVELVCLAAAERAAGVGLAEAQAAGVEFSVLRSGPDGGSVSLRIGPRLDDDGPSRV